MLKNLNPSSHTALHYPPPLCCRFEKRSTSHFSPLLMYPLCASNRFCSGRFWIFWNRPRFISVELETLVEMNKGQTLLIWMVA